MNLDNVSPFLGRFYYSPMYIFLRIKDGQVKELKTMHPPGDRLNCTSFLDDLESLTKHPIKDKISIDSRKHIALFSRKGNLADDFDFDFDIINK